MIEDELLKQAVSAFNTRFSGLNGLELSGPQEASSIDGRCQDAVVHLRAGRRKTAYSAEIKANLTHAVSALLVMKRAALKRPLLLITRYVNPQMAEHLIRDGMEFIDTAGNAFINLGFLQVISKGNQPADTGRLPFPRLFKASGLKLIYALLSTPGLSVKALREIAAKTGISLGAAAGMMDELKTRLYIVEDGRGIRRLIRKKDLFEAWVAAYPENLRPKIHLGRYRGEHGWWHEKTLQPAWAQWGGEVAASRLTDFLFPQEIIIYLTRSRLNEFLMENKLGLDSRGNVEILQRFWITDARAQEQETVHPMLVYADLLASGNKRDSDAAKIIYDQYLAQYLRED